VNRRLLVGGMGAVLAMAVAAVSLSSVSVRSTASDPVTAQGAQVNLSSAAGARDFYARIEQAARSACASPRQDHDAMESPADSCVEGAIARSVREVNSPELTRVYIEHSSHEVSDNVVVTGEMVRLAKN